MRIVMVRGTLAASDSRLSKERDALERAGHEVSILDWNFGRARVDAGDERGVTHFNMRAARGSLALLFALPVWWSWIAWQLVRRDWDVVHACDLDTLPPAVAIARLRARIVVHDVYDYYPDMVANRVPRFMTRLMRAFYTRLLAHVDAVIIADDSRALQLAPRAPDAVVMNTPIDCAPLVRALPREVPARLRVFYAGSLIRDRGLFTLLDAAARLPLLEVEIAGYGRDEDEVRSRCAGLANARFLGRLPYPEVLARSAEADALFAFYDPVSPNNRLASPNKLFEAMMLSRPIVMSDGSVASDRVRELNMGVVVPFGDVEALVAALTRLAHEPASRAELGANGRRAYAEKFNWDEMAHRLVDVYSAFDARSRRAPRRPGPREPERRDAPLRPK